MKSLINFSLRYRNLRIYSFSLFFVGLILFLISCTSKTKPYSILEFTGIDGVNNYSKSFFLTLSKSDSINPAVIMGSKGDLFMCDDFIFLYNDTSSQNKFSCKYLDKVQYVNDKIYSIEIPNDDKMIPWFKNIKEKDLSALQFIIFHPKLPESYLPYLTELAEIKPDAGLNIEGNFRDMAPLLKIFKPRYIVGSDLLPGDYDMLSGLTNLEILMISQEESVIIDPLPSLPALKQLFLTESDKDLALTNNFLINNKQIERVIIQKEGSIDLSILKPLENLKELVVSGSDTILNFDLINNHQKLEVLSITGEDLVYDPALIRLSSIRWMTFSPNVTQDKFNSFIGAHPDLEIIELIQNDTISNLRALSKLYKLYGLTISDTVTDIASIKTLTNLKYLSLPEKFLSDSLNKAEIQKSLPNTRIVANIPFCLGTGWLLLLIPFVLTMRFFARHKK
jgi:hypothetical protein